LALDEPKDTDEVVKVEGFSYVVDRDFLKQVQPIKVDFVDIGFRLSCAVEFGGGCGGSCSTGSCG
jgi:Fe-S cluster assembly iron-binding protein IscA